LSVVCLFVFCSFYLQKPISLVLQ